MKTVKKLFLVLVITFTGVLSASASPINAEPSIIAKEIGELLENPKFEVGDDMLASVTFVLNKENEIVVLSVDTKSSELESYIKSRLNYNKLSVKLDSKNKTYQVPVRLTSE